MRNHLLPPILLLCAGLAGCAETTGFPSLAPRPIEREVMRAEAVPPAPVPAEAEPIPASGEIAEIVARAQAADAIFKAELERARPLIEAGRNAPEGSEAWVAGQQAYSAADASTAPVAESLGELDRRREAASEAGDSAAEAAISDVLIQLQALYEAERAQLTALMPA